MTMIGEALKDAIAAIIDRDAEIHRLREALEPFALVAEHDIGGDEADYDVFRVMDRHHRAPRLLVGDLRRALGAIKGEQ